MLKHDLYPQAGGSNPPPVIMNIRNIGELRKSIAEFADDQPVAGILHQRHLPDGQVGIQFVEAVEPWHEGKNDKSNWIVGLHIHAENAAIPRK